MSENNEFRPDEQSYSDPNNLYHYNYRTQEDQGWTETPVLSKKPSFWQKTGVKVTALLGELGYDNFSAVPAGEYGAVMAKLGEA